MNASKILTSAVVTAATAGVIGFASAQTTTSNAPGTTTIPPTQAQPTIVVPSLPTDPTLQPLPSPAVSGTAGTTTINSGSTDSSVTTPASPATTTNSPNTSNSNTDSTSGTMNKDAAATSNSRASRATGSSSNDAGTMRTERAPKADRN